MSLETLEVQLPEEGYLLREYLRMVIYNIRTKPYPQQQGNTIIIQGNIVDLISQVLDLAKQKIQLAATAVTRVRKSYVELSLMGNDRKKLLPLCRFLRLQSQSQTISAYDIIEGYKRHLKSECSKLPLNALRYWNDGYAEDAKELEIRPIEIFRPQRYEYGRTNGYLGERKKETILGPCSTVLGIAGYILARQQRSIRLGPKTYVTPLAVPDDIGYRADAVSDSYGKMHRDGMDMLLNGTTPGVACPEALILWMGSLWRKAARLTEEFSNITFYLLQEPSGQQPAYLRGKYTMQLAPFARVAAFMENVPNAINQYHSLLREALRPDASEQSFAARISRLAYLAITGSADPWELVYVASRERLVASGTNKNSSYIKRIAPRVALNIQNALERAFY